MAIRVVSDSSSDLYSVSGVAYTTVPLKVRIGSREFVDVAEASSSEMMAEFQVSDEISSTSCPSIQEWLDAFEGYTEIIGLTISSKLSASYECACQAKDMYLEQHPEAKVYIVDTRTTGPSMRLLIEHMQADIEAGKSFEEVVSSVEEYNEQLRILFPLSSMQNLARNGRVNQAIAMLADVLNIWLVGEGTPEGEINLLHKCRGENKALKHTYNDMLAQGYAGGKVRIDHCMNEVSAEKLKKKILDDYPNADICISPCGLLCSYYADEGGLIVGFEVS